MHILYLKTNRHVKRRINEALKQVYISISNNKIKVPAIEVPYNKGSTIEETMTDREILLQLQKTVAKGFTEVKQDITEIKQDITEVKQDITEIKQDINNIVKKNNLKR